MFCPVMADLARYERDEARAAAEECAAKDLLAEHVKDADRVAESLDLSDPIDVAEAMVAAKGKPDAVRLAVFDALAEKLWAQAKEPMYVAALAEVRERWA